MGKYDFKPDRQAASALSRLYVTKKQRRTFLRWLLIGLILVALSLLQDVVMSRLRPFGTTTDLVAGGILLCAMLLTVEQSAVFAVWASTIFYFAGFAPGVYTIALLTGLAIFFNILRHSYLRKGMFSVVACAGAALMIYECAVFFIAQFLEQTVLARFGTFALGGGLTVAVMPGLYPVFRAVTKIGGEAWKE